jgi:hypothetical protein
VHAHGGGVGSQPQGCGLLGAAFAQVLQNQPAGKVVGVKSVIVLSSDRELNNWVHAGYLMKQWMT